MAAERISAEEVLLQLRKAGIPEDFFDDEKFNPFVHWNEGESEAVMLKRLRGWKRKVDAGVDTIIEKYHKGFTSSTASFSHILGTFTNCQIEMAHVESAVESKKIQNMHTEQTQKSLRELWFQSEVYKKMLQILEKIERVMTIPAILDSLIKKKQYLHAVRILQVALHVILQPDLRSIESLSEIHETLLAKRTYLQDLLIEEIHKHIYLRAEPVEYAEDLISAMDSFKSPFRRGSRSRSPSRLGSSHPRSRSKRRNFSSIETPESTFQASPILSLSSSPLRSNFSKLGFGNSLEFDEIVSKYSYSKADLNRSILILESDFLKDIWSGKSNKNSETEKLYLLEESEEYLFDPLENSELIKSIMVEALYRLEKIPPLTTAIVRQLGNEIRTIIDEIALDFKGEILSAQENSRLSEFTESRGDSELLLELMEKWFSVCTKILKNHQNLCKLIQQKIDIDLKTILEKGGHVGKLSIVSETNENEFLKRDSVDDPEYSISFVWDVMQKELCNALSEFLQARTRNVSQQVPAGENHEVPVFSFSFSNSNLQSIARKNKLSKRQLKSNNNILINAISSMHAAKWINPSPYLVVYMYRPVVQFTDLANSMLGIQTLGSTGGILRSYLSDFVQHSFLPRVKEDAFNCVSDIFLSSSAAFLIIDKVPEVANKSDEIPRGLVQCVHSISKIMDDLFCDFFRMPYDIIDFAEVIITVMERFIERSQDKYFDLTNGTLSAQFAIDRELLSILKQDPLYREALEEEDIVSPSAPGLDEIERKVLTYLKQHLEFSKVFDEMNLLYEQSSLCLLASMAESVLWLKKKLEALVEPLMNYQERLLESRVILHSPGNPGLMNRKGAKRGTGVFEISRLLKEVLPGLAEQCLLTLSLELRLHAIYFLSQIRASSYFCEEESSKPEKFVADLNKDLAHSDERLSRYLSNSRKKFLFQRLPCVFSQLIIDGMSLLVDRRINRNGLHKITRNIFAMQQTMTNVLSIPDRHFDRARQYWECLFEAELPEMIKSKSHALFSSQEIQVLATMTVVQDPKSRNLPLF